MNSGPDLPLLLDTHAWVWLMENSAELSAPTLAAARQASRAGAVYVAAISVWEIAMLDMKRRVSLSMECRAWTRHALTAPGVSLVPFTPDIAIDSTRLPGVVHGDPADRILIATARSLGARLVTRDRTILAYAADTGGLAVLDATP